MAETLCVKLGGGGMTSKSTHGTVTIPANQSYDLTLAGWTGITAVRYQMTNTPANGYTGINLNTEDLYQTYSSAGYIPTVEGNTLTIPRLSAGAVSITYYIAGY